MTAGSTQWTRRTPRTASGLVPSSFKRAIEGAASSDQWKKLPPRPSPEKFRYRGDIIKAARQKAKAKNPKDRVASDDKKKTTDNETRSKPNKKKEWDAYYSGDQEMYKLTKEEMNEKEKVRLESLSFLKEMAEKRKEKAEKQKILESQPNSRVAQCEPHPEHPQSAPNFLSVSEKPTKTVKKSRLLMSAAHEQAAAKKAMQERLVSSRAAFAKAAVSRTRESEPRNHDTAPIHETDDRPPPISVIEVVCDEISAFGENKTILSLGTTHFTEDESVIAAKEALEHARARLEGLGLLNQKKAEAPLAMGPMVLPKSITDGCGIKERILISPLSVSSRVSPSKPRGLPIAHSILREGVTLPKSLLKDYATITADLSEQAASPLGSSILKRTPYKSVFASSYFFSPTKSLSTLHKTSYHAKRPIIGHPPEVNFQESIPRSSPKGIDWNPTEICASSKNNDFYLTTGGVVEKATRSYINQSAINDHDESTLGHQWWDGASVLPQQPWNLNLPLSSRLPTHNSISGSIFHSAKNLHAIQRNEREMSQSISRDSCSVNPA